MGHRIGSFYLFLTMTSSLELSLGYSNIKHYAGHDVHVKKNTPGNKGADGSNNEASNGYRQSHWFMDESKAKTIVNMRPKSALQILMRMKRGWLEEQNENLFKREEGRERERNREISERSWEASCRATCLGPWEPWGLCNKQCGAYGMQTRVRDPIKSCNGGCPGETSQDQECNRFCLNGGIPTIGGIYKPCACVQDFEGDCCEITPSTAPTPTALTPTDTPTTAPTESLKKTLPTLPTMTSVENVTETLTTSPTKDLNTINAIKNLTNSPTEIVTTTVMEILTTTLMAPSATSSKKAVTTASKETLATTPMQTLTSPLTEPLWNINLR